MYCALRTVHFQYTSLITYFTILIFFSIILRQTKDTLKYLITLSNKNKFS